MNGLRYRVAVLVKKGAQFGYSPDNKIVLPHGTFAKQFGFRVLRNGVNLTFVSRWTEDLEKVIEKTIAALRVRRKVPFDKPNDFAVVTPDQLISQFQAITSGVTGAMIFIALISRHRWRRRDEHHAGLRHAADEGNRDPQGGRCAAARHHQPVPGRSRDSDERRGNHRHRARTDLGDRPRTGSVLADVDPALVACPRPCCFDGSRHFLRGLSCREGIALGPDRVAQVGVGGFW